jgi:hypothetical protein
LPTTVTIDSITTEDVAPAAAPYRISGVAGFSTATLLFTPTHDGTIYPMDTLALDEGVTPLYPAPNVRKIIAYRVRMGGTDFKSGVDLGRKGEPCGQEPCSAARKCTSWNSDSGVQLTEVIDYAETGGPADGDKDVTIYVNTDLQGWS